MTNTLLKTEFANVTKVNLVEDIDELVIQHQYCAAKVSLYGGQVLSYQPVFHSTDNSSSDLPKQKQEQADVFWLSKDAYYQKGKAIRGGIPLCWPWFGANDNATDKIPSTNHGFAREALWTIASLESNEANVTLVLVLQGDNQHALWPHAFTLKQTLVFGKNFKQSLAMTNLTAEDLQYSGALHNYFSVSHPENITIADLTGCHFDDKLTAKTNRQKDSVSCVGPIDREYHIQSQSLAKKNLQKIAERSNQAQASTLVMFDKGWQRQIEIMSIGCAQWVLWNPGSELASNMADIHVSGEQEFVCLEAANSKWQLLPANKTITISQEIKVSRLPS
jgi:glucose-6-phosphate 1-epimerase